MKSQPRNNNLPPLSPKKAIQQPPANVSYPQYAYPSPPSQQIQNNPAIRFESPSPRVASRQAPKSQPYYLPQKPPPSPP